MAWYHFALLGLAGGALWASWKLPRCRLWVAVAAASYVLSVVYFRATDGNPFYPHGSFIAFLCDSIAFVIIRETHKQKWEVYGLGGIMLTCATFNFVQLAAVVFGSPPVLDQSTYSEILEGANALYLLMIGGMGYMEAIADGQRSMPDHRSRPMAQAVHHAYAKATKKTKFEQTLRRW
jgi:hypothetical protein